MNRKVITYQLQESYVLLPRSDYLLYFWSQTSAKVVYVHDHVYCAIGQHYKSPHATYTLFYLIIIRECHEYGYKIIRKILISIYCNYCHLLHTGCIFARNPRHKKGWCMMMYMKKWRLIVFFPENKNKCVCKLDNFQNQNPPYPSSHLQINTPTSFINTLRQISNLFVYMCKIHIFYIFIKYNYLH